MLYKYLKGEHLESFIKTGNVRIGTLFEYRDAETHGHAVGDTDEGRITKHQYVEHQIVDPRSSPTFADRVVKAIGGASISIENCILAVEESVENYYVLSFSEIFDEVAMGQFSYDACYEILYPKLYFRRLSFQIKSFARPLGVFRCVYGSKNLRHDEKPIAYPAILKDERYAYQREIRMIWSSLHNPMKAKIVSAETLVPLTRVIRS